MEPTLDNFDKCTKIIDEKNKNIEKISKKILESVKDIAEKEMEICKKNEELLKKEIVTYMLIDNINKQLKIISDANLACKDACPGILKAMEHFIKAKKISKRGEEKAKEIFEKKGWEWKETEHEPIYHVKGLDKLRKYLSEDHNNEDYKKSEKLRKEFYSI